jgi:flagellar motor switch protein FliN/FliY
MPWDTLAWSPADESTLGGAGAIVDLVPLLRSAVDESASALVMGPVSIADLGVATATATDLPEGFVPLTSFELLGTPRRTAWVALDPSTGSALGDATVTAESLGAALLEGFDGALVAIVGEGLGLAPVIEATPAPDGELLLLRIGLRDAAGADVGFLVAVDSTVPSELATHIVALQALGADVRPAATSGPSTASTASTTSAGGGALAASPATPPAPPPPSAPASVPAVATAAASAHANVRPLPLEELTPAPAAPGIQNIDLLMGVHLQVTVEIGRTRLAIRDVLALTPGSIVELDKLAGEKVDVLVNGHAIASGEVVVVDDNFGVRITDVVSRQRRIMSADNAA